MTESQIKELISAEVVTTVLGSIPEFFGSIKTNMNEIFDDRYVTLSEAVVVVTTTTVAVAEVLGEREPSSIGTSLIRSAQCSMEFRIRSLR